MEFKKVERKREVHHGYYPKLVRKFLESDANLWEAEFETIEERNTVRNSLKNYRKMGIRVSVSGNYLYLERA